MSETPLPVVSVKFDPVGRVHRFLLPELTVDEPLKAGDRVVVTRGSEPEEVATVVRSIPAITERHRVDDRERVVRRATEGDVLARLKHEQAQRDAHRIVLMKIRERGLAMKLTRVERAPDGTRVIVYFTADGRVDFRELIRDLAAEFRTRIEMRQIGVRDEARLLGGYGSCGRPLCCTTWLQTFEPVSMKMAKQQRLSLNPSKLSGLCGRLKCCLRYELPNAAGERYAGCAHESSCSGGGCAGGDACGSGTCERCAGG